LPHYYQDQNFNAYFFCGYDNKSNLFVDGADVGSYHTLFAELPNGSTTFKDIKLNQTIGYPGAVQWDGKYVAVGDTFADALYRFKISGANGVSAGKVVFKTDHNNLVTQFSIVGSTIVLPYGTLSRDVHKLGFWRYPAGGVPAASLNVPRAVELIGVTLSVKK
jgi:hypothetical protein